MSEPSVPVLSGWKHVYSGKVRDLYIPDTARRLADAAQALVVASDRVSAFDYSLSPGIPGKGELLTTLSLWWFGQLDGIPNHLIPGARVPDEVAGRAMVVRPLDMFPIECVVRGYLVGGGWAEYREAGTVCGIRLPAGLENGDQLPEPIFTPAFKAAQGEHDENITFERTVDLVGADAAGRLRDLSLEVYRRASALALERGIVIADTKFEFGADRDTGEVTLGDEVLTSDSSRYWDAEAYAAGGPDRLASFDKQIVRDWLATHWDRTGTPPSLPPEIVARTAERYRALIARLTA